MQKHTKIYFDAVKPHGPALCEICGSQANSTHHIYCRGMGGTFKDVLENLMALCNHCHDKYGDKVQHYDFLLLTHKQFLESNGIPFDEAILESVRKK